MPFFCRPRFVGLVLTAALASGCDSAQPPMAPSAAPPAVSSPAPAPEGPTQPPPPTQPSPPAFPRYRVTGRVTNEAGSPVPNAPLVVEFVRREGAPTTPTCNPHACWIDVRSDAAGFYAVEFEPGPSRTGQIGILFSLHQDYETNVQVVPDGSNSVVLNLRLRDIRLLTPGERVAVDGGADSTRCTDLENYFLMDQRCEVVRVVVDRPGCVFVTARTATGAVPSMFPATSGNYGPGPCRAAPDAWWIHALGGSYMIFLVLPDGSAAQQFEVTTSLQ
jgi:hypothetical protein